MKTIQLKELRLPLPTGGLLNEDNQTYGYLINTCVNHLPKGGWSVKEMKDSLKIQEKVDAAKSKEAEILELEDAEFDYFYKKLSEMAWGLRDKQIVEFQDYIDRIKENGDQEHNQPTTQEGEQS